MPHFQHFKCLFVLLAILVFGCEAETGASGTTPPLQVRIATYNVEDIRSSDIRDPESMRLRKIAEVVASVQPDILLLNEVAYDWPTDSTRSGENAGLNGRLLAETFLNSDSLTYHAFMPEPNTGIASGFDLDRNGAVVETPGTRDYGNDSWGFGTFPGQYGLVILVSDRFEIDLDRVRTFRTLRWSSMPGALRPFVPETGDSWYEEEAWAQFPLSSKTHADVPVRLTEGRELHILASHPTPPAFDGLEARNKRRNHDEIRFWADYLENADYVVDDSGLKGGLARDKSFVIAGDLNADPNEGSSMNNPVEKFLLSNPMINAQFTPFSPDTTEGLDPDDTAGWGLRVDYVLPSADLEILDGGIVRVPDGPSDHSLVWIDIAVQVLD